MGAHLSSVAPAKKIGWSNESIQLHQYWGWKLCSFPLWVEVRTLNDDTVSRHQYPIGECHFSFQSLMNDRIDDLYM